MSRGGFGGGGRNTGGKMNGQPLPFDVDPDLEQEINGYGADDITKDPAEDPRQALFPVSGKRKEQQQEIPLSLDCLQAYT